ncbi:MAG TPA: transcription-repair coupling factor [Chloroflexi bacterium]|nr:transcription-repair coupling factor [Chloroflexota bacterium]
MAEIQLTGLLVLLEQHPAFNHLVHDLRRGPLAAGSTPMALQILSAARPYVTAALAETLNRPIILITARPELALQFEDQLRLWLSDPRRLFNFPDPGALPYERAPWSPDRVQRRIGVLTALTRGSEVEGRADSLLPPLIVTSARALLHPTIPVEEFRRNLRTYAQSQSVSLRFLLASWYAIGYESTNIVAEPGQFSHRGGILDIFPINATNPARIELWGDEIESIRLFDPITQRSLETVTGLTVPPASEALLHGARDGAAARLRQLDLSASTPQARSEISTHIGHLQNGQHFPGIEFYLPYLYDYDQTGSLLDYLPADGLLVIDDWNTLELNVADIETEALNLRDEMVNRGDLPPAFATAMQTWDDLRDAFSQRPPLILGYGPEEIGYAFDDLFQAGPRYGGRLNEAVEAMHDQLDKPRQAEASRYVVVTRQAERLAELLADEGLHVRPRTTIPAPPGAGTLTLLNGSLGEGFLLRSADADGPIILNLVTDAELFGWSRMPPRRTVRARQRPTAESFFAEIQEGDYVVHIEHGIGLYRGLVQREINGLIREYLELEYAQGDRLFVPVHQADRVSRYIGPTDSEPAIHRLGTADWEQARRRARRAVEEIAEELLELYAQREAAEGYAFSEDTAWQAEIEASFPYVETEDQLRAIEEVKQDMERPRPMDRLVVGDVGFGKTEVALRAAFKAVIDGKQVAILVPTTVLAQQHFTTFTQRLAAYPVTVEMLSRFRSPGEQQEIIERLTAGKVDIVIGTHRLLSGDVKFKDLGLVIVDEEQRFGVTHKERLKQLRTEVDVLTLSATPIPRTLHMALTSVRDMSTIDTPPEERLPIINKVTEWDDTTVKMAILREIDRGGQAFFVHNRVLTIYADARRLQALVPEASFAVAHGQMNEHELERVMLDFAEGRYDVLVCTSIIESGLDLPNVNTIIVDHAEMFGLAQLYQLRGRVGRGARRGYAYFLHPRESSLTADALERLNTIREATELGAGFRIALKDLEIRGAGDLLGARQSGHIAAVGFDMYTRLLAQAVREARERGRGAQAVFPPQEQDTPTARSQTGDGQGRLLSIDTGPAVDLPLQAYLPQSYIGEEAMRLRIYRRMAETTSLEEARDIEHELRDRFGECPPPVENLLFILRLRALAAQANVTSIGTENKQLVIQFPGPGAVRLMAEAGILAGVVRYGRREVFLPMRGSEGQWKEALEDVMLALAARNQPLQVASRT